METTQMKAFVNPICFTSVICSGSQDCHVDLFCPLQSTSCTALEMLTSAKVLQVILEYIYTDESPTIRGISLLALKTNFNHHNGHIYNYELCLSVLQSL